MRKDFLELLDEKFIIKRFRRITDGVGGVKEEWQVVDTIKGRLSTIGSRRTENFESDTLQSEIKDILFTVIDADIKKGDRVLGEGKDLLVVAVKNPSHINHHLEVEVEEYQLEFVVILDSDIAESSSLTGVLTKI